MILTYGIPPVGTETLPILTLDAQDSLGFALHSQLSFVLMGPQQVIDFTIILLKLQSSGRYNNAKIIKYFTKRTKNYLKKNISYRMNNGFL